MALTIYGYHDYPNAFAVTKVGEPQEDCPYLLDFARPLQKIHWLGRVNNWIGPVVGILVPVVHVGEKDGGYCISVNRADGHYDNICSLWKQHYKTRRTLFTEPANNLQLAADFGRHFPEDAQ